MKRYEAYTRTDKQGRMIGHFCLSDAGCAHCELGIPFMPPPPDALRMFSGALLTGMAQKLATDIDAAQDVMFAIVGELGKRGELADLKRMSDERLADLLKDEPDA